MIHFIIESFSADGEDRQFLLHYFPGLYPKIVPIEDALGAPVIREEMFRDLSFEAFVRQMASLLEQTDRLFFWGFWQDEKYFGGDRNLIRTALRPSLSPAARLRVDSLRRSECIGLHMRRAGYGHMGLVRVSYYRNAIAAIRQEKGPLPVKCFSDERGFCEYILRDIGNIEFISDQNIKNPIVDFALLAACRHQIIANSSFSWWAAWLAEIDQSIIYAPQPWILPDLETNPVPPRWRTIADAIQAP